MHLLPWTAILNLVALCSLAAASYPIQVNTTTPSAVFFQIFSYDNLNGRSLQLRTMSDGRQVVVIDATSPVLWAEMRKGVIYSEAKTNENQRYDLGPVSHLKNVSSTSTSSLQEFYFRNATKADPATAGFILEFPTQDAIYSLYHTVPDGIVNGWVACNMTGYYQLFYNTYISKPPAYKGCTYLGIQVCYLIRKTSVKLK